MGAASWGGGISGFGRGLTSGYDFVTRMQDRKRALEAESLFGQTLSDMYAPKPMEGATTGMPTQAPMRSPMPTALGPRGAPPMPGRGAPPGMPPQGMPPGQMQAPMRPQPTAMGRSYETMPMQESDGKLDWKSAFTSIARRMPNANPAVVAQVVDRLQPMMTQQSLAEWRELKGRIDMLETNRKQTQGDRGLDIRETNADTSRARLEETRRWHEGRLAQLDRDVAAKEATAKLSPEVKGQLDVLRDYYKQMTTSLRTTQTNLQRAMFEGTPENKQQAQADVTEAEAAVKRAQTALDAFVGKHLGIKAGSAAAVSPSVAPASSSPGPTGPGPGPKKPAMPPPGAGSKRVKTKAGNQAEIGFESPEYLAPPPKASGVAAIEPAPSKAATPKVSAQPTGAQGQVYPFPQGSKEAVKAMLVKGRVYRLRNGQTGKWTGTGFLPVGQ